MYSQLRPILLTDAPCFGATLCHLQADDSCNGYYGYTVTGNIVAGSGSNAPLPLRVLGPFAAVGGGVSTVRTLSKTNAVSGERFVNGKLHDDADCMVGPPGDAVQLSLNFVLDDNNGVRAIVTNPNIILLFEARRKQPPTDG